MTNRTESKTQSALLEKIHIMGASGAGKSTLGAALAGQLRVVHLDTDDVYWLPTEPPFRQRRPVEERLALLTEKLLDAHRFVLSGSLSGWGETIVHNLDGIVWLDTPTNVRLGRLSERERRRYGSRLDGELADDHARFMEWAAAYDSGTEPGRSRHRDEAWVHQLSLPWLRLNGSETIGEQVSEIINWAQGL